MLLATRRLHIQKLIYLIVIKLIFSKYIVARTELRVRFGCGRIDIKGQE